MSTIETIHNQNQNIDQLTDDRGEDGGLSVLQVAKNNGAARVAIVDQYQGLIRTIVGRRRGPSGDRRDLMQEGNIGLLLAIDHYEVEAHGPFASYAASWIRGQIHQAIVRDRTPEDTGFDDLLPSLLTHDRTPEALLLEREELTARELWLRQAVGLLPRSERALIEAHWLDQPSRSLMVIGRLRRVSQATVSRTHRRALRLLRELLERRRRQRSLRARRDRRHPSRTGAVNQRAALSASGGRVSNHPR